jgi:osmotically-inducible protein OsmY
VVLALPLLVFVAAAAPLPQASASPEPSPSPFLNPLPSPSPVLGSPLPSSFGAPWPTPTPDVSPSPSPPPSPAAVAAPGRAAPSAPPPPPAPSTLAPRATPKQDATIAAALTRRLITDPEIAARGLDIDVSEGVVTLRGSVASSTAAEKAVEVATTIPGVQGVASALAVRGPAPTDAVMAARIKDSLDRNRGGARTIVVSVVDGVAILSGTASAAARASAERSARRAGARKVVNLIEVRGQSR